MTLQDFISIWQAQPFRAFRIHTGHGESVVNYPLSAALTPEMRIALVVDARVETFTLDEITRCETFGEPMSVAEAVSNVPPDILARNAELISLALASSEPNTSRPSLAFDPGKISLRSAHAPNGVRVVHATVETRDGRQMLSTADTRWNVHGVEQFENGTSLYLHHLDHPTVEQRILVWPPDLGTFDTFAEAVSTAALASELRRRDAELTAKPAKAVGPPSSYFRKIDRVWEIAERDGWEEAFGDDSPALDPLCYEFALVPRALQNGLTIRNPALTDIMKEEILFNLVDTDWDAKGEQEGRSWHLSLHHASCRTEKMTLHIDVDRRAATIDDDTTLLPLGWIERHLRNFALYEYWDLMHDGLLAGPVKRKRPDVVIPVAGGFSVQLWAGEPRFTLPFLQPHIIDADGRTVLDFRATTWAARIQPDKKRPVVSLVLSSGDHGVHEAMADYPLEIDLITHQVTCRNLQGATTAGMLQAVVRHARGTKWMLEEIPKWFEKGRSLQ